jgi:hypothetical protein
MLIDSRHPDRDQPLLAHAAAALERLGAQVRIAVDGDNLVRRSEPRDDTAAPMVVEAEGLKNLLHELVHVVLLGRLAPDHATDYRAIPFDVRVPAQRELLWQELACCVVSCAYLSASDDEVDAWFAEQVGIQHAFFSLGGGADGFAAALESLIAAHQDELELAIESAYRGTEALLQQPPVRRPAFARLWAARQRRSGTSPRS